MNDLPKINHVYIVKDNNHIWQLCIMTRMVKNTITIPKCVVRFVSTKEITIVGIDRLFSTIDGIQESKTSRKKKREG